MVPRRGNLANLRVLVVEDELLVAMIFEDVLEELQCQSAGCASSLAEALAAIDADTRIDGVLLDLNLHGKTTLPVAEKLRDQGVPFILVTGYTKDTREPSVLRNARRLNKPFNLEMLADAMTKEFLK